MVSLRLCTLLLIALCISACSTVQISAPQEYTPDSASLNAEQPERSWWQLRFKLTWPEDEAPDFSRHLLIADQIIAPALVAHEDEIELWRIHRRAARTPSGHQFSLIIYTDNATAQVLAADVETHPLTLWLLERDMIEQTRFDRRTTKELATLEDTSDRSWPAEIQRSWPYFIMGASQSWLLMVQELSAGEALAGTVSYDDLLAHYVVVHEQLTAQWREFGQHAYLHHLSAIFGYQPIRVRSSELRSF